MEITPRSVQADLPCVMTLEEIKEAVQANQLAGRFQYEGLSSAEIGRYSQALMFGDDWEAFPEDYDDWRRIVD